MELAGLVLPRKSRLLRAALRAALPLSLLFAGCDIAPNNNTGDMKMNAVSDMMVQSRYGFVRMASNTATSGSQTQSDSSVIALFLDTNQVGAGCQRQVSGECQLYNCSGGNFMLPTAGGISISGGTQAVSLMPRTDGSYNAYGNSSTAIFPGGQKLLVDAPGAMVPAFHAEVTPPSGTFMLTNPDGSRLTILVDRMNRHADYTLTWSGITPGTRVHAELTQDTDNNHGLVLECDYDGSRGNGVIPATLLSNFQVTSGNFHVGGLVIGPAMTTSLKVNGWDISAIAIAGGRDALVTVTDS